MIVKENAFGQLGVFAEKRYRKNELIAQLEGAISTVPSKYSIQIGNKEHLEVIAPFKYLNHHCNPNALVKGKSLFARQEIESGEEIFFNYNTTEAELAAPFVCKCCNSYIKGRKYILQKNT